MRWIVSFVKLPVKIDIIKHANETDGKSTAIHAKILAPSDVTIYTFPCIPDYEKDKVSFIFILKNSKPLFLLWNFGIKWTLLFYLFNLLMLRQIKNSLSLIHCMQKGF